MGDDILMNKQTWIQILAKFTAKLKNFSAPQFSLLWKDQEW
jgi:hypothetical protein